MKLVLQNETLATPFLLWLFILFFHYKQKKEESVYFSTFSYISITTYKKNPLALIAAKGFFGNIFSIASFDGQMSLGDHHNFYDSGHLLHTLYCRD